MLKKMKKALPVVVAAAMFAGALVAPVGMVYADEDPDVPATTGKTTCPPGSKNAGQSMDSLAQCNMDKADTENTLMSTVQIIINVIIGVLGVLAVVMIVLGGVTFVTSQGDPAKTKKAKDTILYGIIGLVVALLAYAIVNFVLSSIWTNP